jgi:hypothetical protein
MTQRIDLTGKRFGKLVVLSADKTTVDGTLFWKCLCDCGKEKSINGGSLRYGKTHSCGCLEDENRQQLIEARTTHGRSINGTTPTYNSWSHAKARCTDINNTAYNDYGGRGISICDRWLESFENFLEDMGTCPKGMSIERIDNNKGYSKENCKWATMEVQNKNRRSTILFTMNGITKCITDWADVLGINRKTVFTRLHLGWNIKTALTFPVRGC